MSLKQNLNDIDLQLEAMPKKNRLMVYASVTMLFLGISYYGFGVSLTEENEQKHAEIESMNSEIQKINPNLYAKLIKKEETKILKIAQATEEEKYKSTALRVKLEGMDYLSADEKGLADILDRILKESVRLNINIEKIKIDKLEGKLTSQIEKRGSMTITGKAKIYPVQKLLRFIEAQEALLQVDYIKFNINEEENIDFPDFKIILVGYEVVI